MLTRDQILARKLGRDVVQIGPDPDDVVKVRGLNREEAIALAVLDDPVERDRFLIATGLVEPIMTVDDVAEWGKQDGGGPGSALEKVSQRIGELSGMVEGAGKSGVPRARRRS